MIPGKLGKKDPEPISFRYSDVFNRDKLQQAPLVFGHVWNSTQVPFLGNNHAGDCVWATQAHLLNCMQRGSKHAETVFSEDSVLSDYSACTGYVRGDAATDKGTSMAQGADYWRKTGMVDAGGQRHKIDAYVQIKLRDMDEMMQAAFDFGGIGIGVQLPQSAREQFGKEPWSVVSGSRVLGGHAIALVGRNSSGNAVLLTWDGITAATMAWLDTFMDEAVAFLSLDYLDARGVNPRGYDRAQILAMLAALWQH